MDIKNKLSFFSITKNSAKVAGTRQDVPKQQASGVSVILRVFIGPNGKQFSKYCKFSNTSHD